MESVCLSYEIKNFCTTQYCKTLFTLHQMPRNPSVYRHFERWRVHFNSSQLFTSLHHVFWVGRRKNEHIFCCFIDKQNIFWRWRVVKSGEESETTLHTPNQLCSCVLQRFCEEWRVFCAKVRKIYQRREKNHRRRTKIYLRRARKMRRDVKDATSGRKKEHVTT